MTAANSISSLSPIPITLLTGFLGSGKTTVLNHALKHVDAGRTVVIINEFGDVGLDHELVEASIENMVLLQSGCLCCTIRGDLIETVHGLLDRRERQEIAVFDRVIIETTGLADPAPILHTLITDQVLASRFALDGVIVTVDAATGPATLDAQIEAVKQVAVADRLLVTKSDLVDAQSLADFEARLRGINPSAPIIRTLNGAVDLLAIWDVGLYDPQSKSEDVQNWLNVEAFSAAKSHFHYASGDQQGSHVHWRIDEGEAHEHPAHRHDDQIRSVCYTIDAPIAPMIFDIWLDFLIQRQEPSILRLKGLIHVIGMDTPFVLHGVQHLFHPPVPLESWPTSDRTSRIVLITRNLSDEFLAQSFAFLTSGTQLSGRKSKAKATRARRSPRASRSPH